MTIQTTLATPPETANESYWLPVSEQPLKFTPRNRLQDPSQNTKPQQFTLSSI